MGKIRTVEIVIRGDIIERNIILKLANRVREARVRADLSSSVAVPPFLTATEKRYPSLAVLYGNVDLEDSFALKSLVEGLCFEEGCEVLSYKEL